MSVGKATLCLLTIVSEFALWRFQGFMKSRRHRLPLQPNQCPDQQTISATGWISCCSCWICVTTCRAQGLECARSPRQPSEAMLRDFGRSTGKHLPSDAGSSDSSQQPDPLPRAGTGTFYDMKCRVQLPQLRLILSPATSISVSPDFSNVSNALSSSCRHSIHSEWLAINRTLGVATARIGRAD